MYFEHDEKDNKDGYCVLCDKQKAAESSFFCCLIEPPKDYQEINTPNYPLPESFLRTCKEVFINSRNLETISGRETLYTCNYCSSVVANDVLSYDRYREKSIIKDFIACYTIEDMGYEVWLCNMPLRTKRAQ